MRNRVLAQAVVCAACALSISPSARSLDPLSATLSSPAGASLVGAKAATPLDAKWGRKKLNFKRLPDDMDAQLQSTLLRWDEWASEVDYHMHLAEDTRLLLLGHKKGSWLGKRLDLALEVVERFDELILDVGAVATSSGPEGAEADGSGGGVAVLDDPIDDQPFFEELPFGGTLADARKNAPTEAAGGADDDLFVPNSALAVLVLCEEKEAYESLVLDIGKRDSDLKDWASEAQYQTGFVLTAPPTGAFVVRSEIQEEFNPDNELVNRVAQMMLLRRFGSEIPFWALQGFSWRVETDVQGVIYCYPYRNDFVSVNEHGGWNTELANLFRAKERKDRPLSVEDFAHWRRGSYQDRYAKIAWGLVSWLCLEDNAAFTQFLDEMREYAHVNNRADLGDGRWERIKGFEVPIDFQKETLEKLFGADMWERATADFKKRKIK